MHTPLTFGLLPTDGVDKWLWLSRSVCRLQLTRCLEVVAMNTLRQMSTTVFCVVVVTSRWPWDQSGRTGSYAGHQSFLRGLQALPTKRPLPLSLNCGSQPSTHPSVAAHMFRLIPGYQLDDVCSTLALMVLVLWGPSFLMLERVILTSFHTH
jgi:hypothetical protein